MKWCYTTERYIHIQSATSSKPSPQRGKQAGQPVPWHSWGGGGSQKHHGTLPSWQEVWLLGCWGTVWAVCVTPQGAHPPSNPTWIYRVSEKIHWPNKKLLCPKAKINHSLCKIKCCEGIIAITKHNSCYRLLQWKQYWFIVLMENL